MSQIYTQRFAGARLAGGVWHLLLTAQPGYVWVIRDLIFTNEQQTGAATYQFVITTRDDLGVTLASGLETPALTSIHADVRQELLEDETLSIFSDAADFSVLVTGYKFTAG